MLLLTAVSDQWARWVGATCLSDSSELVVGFELETVLVFMDAELGQIVMLLLDPERAGCC